MPSPLFLGIPSGEVFRDFRVLLFKTLLQQFIQDPGIVVPTELLAVGDNGRAIPRAPECHSQGLCQLLRLARVNQDSCGVRQHFRDAP